MAKALCVIVGVGPGNGLALCNRFVDEGYQVAILARSLERMQEYAADNEAVSPFSCDASDPASIEKTFGEIVRTLGVPTVVMYNAGSGFFGPALEASQEDFEMAWRINALGLLSVAQSVAPQMIANGGGNIVVTGATASLRGGANFAAFASAKAAQRNLAQSLARSLGPQGVHVSLVIVDGIIDIPRTREMFPELPDYAYMQPAAIADTYYAITQQSRSAWTFEIDLRTSNEKW